MWNLFSFSLLNSRVRRKVVSRKGLGWLWNTVRLWQSGSVSLCLLLWHWDRDGSLKRQLSALTIHQLLLVYKSLAGINNSIVASISFTPPHQDTLHPNELSLATKSLLDKHMGLDTTDRFKRWCRSGLSPVTDSRLGALSGMPQFMCEASCTVGGVTTGGVGVAVVVGGSGGKSWPSEEEEEEDNWWLFKFSQRLKLKLLVPTEIFSILQRYSLCDSVYLCFLSVCFLTDLCSL